MKRTISTLCLTGALLLAAGPRAEALLTTIVITNNTDTYLALYNVSLGSYVSVSFGGSHGVGSPPHVTTFTVDDAYTYVLGTYLFNSGGLPGHTFTFSGGLPVSVNTNQYFQILGDSITVNGVALEIGLVSVPSGSPFEFLCANSGCSNFSGFPNTNGPPVRVILPPDDGYFDGLYPTIQFLTSGANPIHLQFLEGIGIQSVTGIGSSYTPDPADLALHGFVTLSNGRVLELRLIPEPTSATLVLLSGLLGYRVWRRHGA